MTDIFDQSNAKADNVPEYSVSDLSFSIKRTIEQAYGLVRVRGEISGYRGPHSSGHCYFRLKDNRAALDAVIWRGVFKSLKWKPEEGLDVQVTGKISTFPGSSKYQIVIEKLEPAGAGALMTLLEERRKKLAAEGLFDEARKNALPFLPRSIGVITSPTGAVIRDILHRIQDRMPLPVLLWPVRVQGETSADEIVSALEGMNALPEAGEIVRPDVLIVARGGGSLEDLWSFNEERVVRAIGASTIPVIAAIGHETDWTLADFAADRRAPTPTGAAEIAVPVIRDLQHNLVRQDDRLQQACARYIQTQRTNLANLARLIPSLVSLLAPSRQRFDDLADRLKLALIHHNRACRNAFQLKAGPLRASLLQRQIERLNNRVEDYYYRLSLAGRATVKSPRTALVTLSRQIKTQKLQKLIEYKEQQLHPFSQRLALLFQHNHQHKQERLNNLNRVLNTLSYRQTLLRGFVLVRNAKGEPLRSNEQAACEERLELEFHDGHMTVRPVPSHSGGSPQATKEKPVALPSEGGSKSAAPPSQRDLFSGKI
jgi:exodeoxyribonuclease VII large subunit